MQELIETNHKIGDHRNPHLSHYGITTGSKESFDFQILFNVFKECFNVLGDHRNPYLSHYGITTGSKESFDFQILFNVFKECFNVPSRFINISYCLGIILKILKNVSMSHRAL
jgi:hypothetical protein